jgi:hypothetical protein
MRSRFIFLPDRVLAPKTRGAASRVAGAIVFIFVGAVAATELYPQVIADRHSEYTQVRDSGRAAPPIPAPDAISHRPEAFSSRDSAEYLGGPIPQLTFPPTQPPAVTKETQAVAHEDPSASVVGVEKPRRTETKSAHKKHNSHRGNGNTQDRIYREQPSYWAAGGGSNLWGRY